jgi:putative Holliday junction resolvase
VPVRLADERLTTVTASRMLSDRGVKGGKQRAVVDQAAAVEILQSWLDGRAAALARAEVPADENGGPSPEVAP